MESQHSSAKVTVEIFSFSFIPIYAKLKIHIPQEKEKSSLV